MKALNLETLRYAARCDGEYDLVDLCTKAIQGDAAALATIVAQMAPAPADEAQARTYCDARDAARVRLAWEQSPANRWGH